MGCIREKKMARKSTKQTQGNKKTTNSKTNRRGQTTQERLKYEIANEYGIELGPNTSSKQNGTVGGEVTKKLVEKGKTSKRSSSNR